MKQVSFWAPDRLNLSDLECLQRWFSGLKCWDNGLLYFRFCWDNGKLFQKSDDRFWENLPPRFWCDLTHRFLDSFLPLNQWYVGSRRSKRCCFRWTPASFKGLRLMSLFGGEFYHHPLEVWNDSLIVIHLKYSELSMDVESSNSQDFVFRENILSSFYITIDCSFILEGCDEISAGAFKHIETPPKLIFLCHCPCQCYDVLMKTPPKV